MGRARYKKDSPLKTGLDLDKERILARTRETEMDESDVTIAPASGPCHAADFGSGREITTAHLAPIHLRVESNIMETGEKKVTIRINWACSMGVFCKNTVCHYSNASRRQKRAETTMGEISEMN